MNAFLTRYATPLITGLFIVSLVSGIALFFHFQSGAFHAMHEWLSMVLILPFLLHIWKNWRAFVNYFRRTPMALALGLSLVISIPFAWPALTSAQQSRGNPMVAMSGLVLGGTVAEVAPLVDHTPEALLAVLKEKGFTAAATEKTLREVASGSGKSDRELVGVLASLGRQPRARPLT